MTRALSTLGRTKWGGCDPQLMISFTLVKISKINFSADLGDILMLIEIFNKFMFDLQYLCPQLAQQC